VAAPGSELLRQHKGLARARDVGPVAVEVGDEALDVLALHRAIERRLIVELIGGLMDRGISEAPEPPGLLHAERLAASGMCTV
jgi:hypothetical protein